MVSRLTEYIFMRFYIPDYGLQGIPVHVPMRYVRTHTRKQVISFAFERWVRYGLRPVGSITNRKGQSILGKILRHKITYDIYRAKKLTRKQVSNQWYNLFGKTGAKKIIPKGKVGWKRRYGKK